MAYTKTQWNTGDPITQERMNHIEDGISDAHDGMSSLSTSVSSMNDTVESIDTDLVTAKNDITQLKRDVATIGQNSAAGTKAWAQVSDAIEMSGDVVTKSLAQRFSNAEALITSVSSEVSAARKGQTDLVTKIEQIDTNISALSGGITSINNTFAEASNSAIFDGNYGSVDARMEADEIKIRDLRIEMADTHQSTAFDRVSAPYGSLDARLEDGESRIVAIRTELDNAHESTALNKTGANAYGSIDDRFEAIESELVGTTAMSTRLDTIEDNIDSLSNNKVNKLDIANNLTTDTTGKVLDAYQGYLLNGAIGDLDDAYKAADTVLTNRIDAIDNASTGTVHGLDVRVTALETTVDTATTGLSDRMTAAEGDIDDLEAELDTAETGIKARLTDAEERLDALDDTSTGAIADLDSRIDALESTIDTTDTGLTDRVSALETAVNDTTTGLAATKDIADSALSTTATLTTRVTTLEGKDTVVVAYDGEHSNYTNDEPNYANPTTNADYLIADDDGKYFYWRYFGAEDGWQLISGAGGGGSGSSSGTILAELPAVADGDANIDYFIGNSNDGFVHYRFVEAGPGESAGHYIKILPTDLINDAEVSTVTIDNAADADKWPTTESFSGGLEVYAIDDTSKANNLLADFVAVRNARIQAIYDENEQLQSQKLQVLDTNGKLMEYPIVGGSGGGTASLYNARVTSSTQTSRSIPSNSTDPVTISAKVIIQQGNTSLGENAVADGAVQYRIRGTTTWNTGDRIEVTADTQEDRYIIPNDTTFTVDVTKYLVEDTTIEFRLALVAHPTSNENDDFDVYSSTFRVTKVNISIASESFDYASVKNSNFQFNYRCFGSGITKTVHFLVDGNDIVTPITTNSHNTVLQQIIPISREINGVPVFANGMHTFQVYFVTSTGLESNRLNYYILYNTDTARQAPLIGAAAANTSITDGDELIVNYSVSTIGSETTDRVEIELYTMDNGTKNSIQTDVLTNVRNNMLADPPYATFNYPKVTKANENDPDPDPITVYVQFTAYHGELSETQTVQVTVSYLHSNYVLTAAGENNLLYSYNAYGHSNNEANKESITQTFTNISGNSVDFTSTFTNFNWSTDGYVDGKCLVIGGGATMSINVPIFSNQVDGVSLEENADSPAVLEQDITKNGRTIEIDYEVQSATDLNAVIMNCMTNIQTTTENGITTTRANGFQVTPQSCYLLNSSAGIERDESGFILNEDSIAAAYLTPGQRIHLVFVIEPWATDAMRDEAFDGEYHQSTNIYVNGEFANACPYNRDKITGNLAGNNFSTNATITIGNDSCLIKLYSIKLYNRGLTQEQVLQNYKVAPVATRDKLVRMEDNDILNAAGLVDYEKARTKYTCLLLTGPAPVDGNNAVVPTISPFKGSPSPAGRRDKKTNELVGKTESGLTLTKPSSTNTNGYNVEFDLQDTIPEGQAAYLGAAGSYCSSNNVQGTSSQKYPIHNLKVYLAKWQPAVEAEYEEQEVEDPETHEITTQQVMVKEAVSAGIAKVKYSLKGYNEEGTALGTEESTLCWKADYMSTDHANTFNANIADGLFNNRAEDGWPITDWDSKKYQNTVYGIRCLLFQKQGNNPPVFVADGCLNNDKGNSKTYGLEAKTDDGNDTRSQKWEFTNNSEDLGYFKTDDLMAPMGNSIRAKNGFESCYPDEGDLTDEGLQPNYNHLQILLTWVSKRANYWDETDPQLKADKKAIFKSEFTNHFNLNHVLTYYLFSQYVALCDNRVKNMFMRSDNVKEEIIRNSSGTIILEGNNEPDELWSNYVDPSTGATTPSYIDWQTGENHSNFAIWEPVLYDLDSCFGVENVGLIKIRYDADWNYEWKGTPQFNGYNSVFWLMVEDSYKDELAALALSLYNQNPGLNFRTFNQKQIIENQAQISPALTNQDMILKFDKPWSEGFINYAETPDGNGNYPKQTPLYKYLQRGSRAAQKSQFMQQRSMLLSSMYGANEFLNSSIKFRTGVPVGASGNVIGYEDNDPTKPIYGNGDLTETQITLKANQILYPGVAYGDNKPATRVLTNEGKVDANTSCTIQATSAVQGNDGIFIYGASVLTDIGDISKFKPLQLDVSAGVNLKRLIIGSNAAGYENNTTNSITGLNRCTLLEEINVRNLKQMSTLTLTSNGFIKDVYAAGSGIGTISLPQGGVLETIEYGANTTDITIINQGRLTDFSYEDSANNNYANVTRLWIENTPNVPIKDIITARLTATTSEDAGLRAGGLRIIGLDLNLGSDPTFLQLLVSDLAKGTYLSSQGSHIEGNTSYPTITGTIRITSIRRSLLDKLNSIYPDLTITAVDVTEEFEVKYENYDGTLLYTDHGTNDDYLKDPVYDTDPVTNMPYILMPTKPNDVQYEYRFGTYDNQNRYRRFSGWVRKGTSTNPTSGSKINGSITLVAVYPTVITRQYRVTWYDELNGNQLRYTDVNYGDDLSGVQTPIELGLLTRTKSTGNGVKVFNGWSRPLGKITGNVDVYALWQSSTINDATETIVLEELTAADLYALSLTENDTKKRLLQDQLGQIINVPMGQDFNYVEGVQVTNLLNGASYLELDGTTEAIKIFNNIQPLSANKDWTLAIDYKFLMNAGQVNFVGNEYVLVSCYQNANSAVIGFKVSMIRDSSTGHHAIQVSWGTQTQIIDYACTDNELDDKRYFNAYRGVVVLSHNTEDPNVLRISYVLPNTTNQYANQTTDTNRNSYGANYGTYVANTSLTWANNAAIDTPLILGGNYSGSSTTIEEDDNFRRPAEAMIYWAKYWDTDLGESNCSKLAAWPHETVPFYLSGYNGSSDNKSTELIYNGTRLSFVAAQGLGDRYFYSTSAVNDGDADGYFGWHQSGMRTLCNNLVYQGLPEAYKSVINNTNVTSIVRKSDLTGTIAKYTSDYMFLPAVREVNPNARNTDTHGGEVNTSWTSPWSWMVPADKTNVFGFVTGRTDIVETKTATINAYLYRFLGHYITDSARIFSTGTTDPTTIRNLKLQDSDGATTNITVRSGDVWINSSNEAYMYFTAEEIAQGIKINISTTNGGWKRADIWNLRSLNVSGQATETGGTNSRSEGRLICPEFTI